MHLLYCSLSNTPLPLAAVAAPKYTFIFKTLTLTMLPHSSIPGFDTWVTPTTPPSILPVAPPPLPLPTQKLVSKDKIQLLRCANIPTRTALMTLKRPRKRMLPLVIVVPIVGWKLYHTVTGVFPYLQDDNKYDQDTHHTSRKWIQQTYLFIPKVSKVNSIRNYKFSTEWFDIYKKFITECN